MKTEKYRETPILLNLATTIWTAGDIRDGAEEEPVIDVATRTVRRWMERATDDILAEIDEPGWQYVSFNDLRRTRGTALHRFRRDSLGRA